MVYQLSVDCLSEILEYFEDDSSYLRSCLLVNRLWCRVTVRILWRNALRFRCGMRYQLINTLVACLPEHSKNLLQEHGIFLPTLTLKPSFEYATFIRVL